MNNKRSKLRSKSKKNKNDDSSIDRNTDKEEGKFINTQNLHPSSTLNRDPSFGRDSARFPSTERRVIQRAAHTSIGFQSTKANRHNLAGQSERSNTSSIPQISPYSVVNQTYNVNQNSIQNQSDGAKSRENNNHRSSSVISMRDITPEVAAKVVKNYLLPMFDSDSK